MGIIEEKTIKLRKPVVIGKGDGAVTTEVLNLREPTMGELRQALKQTSHLDTLAVLINLVAAVPTAVVDALSQRDMNECADFFGQFSPDEAPPTPVAST